MIYYSFSWTQNRHGIGSPSIDNGARSIEETTGWLGGSACVVQYRQKVYYPLFECRCSSYVGDADVLSVSRENT